MARKESAAELKARATKVYRILLKRHPDACCTLDFANPLQLLVATILAAQCTDERVNILTKDLFARYKSADDFAQADLEKLQELVRPAGFFRNKSKAIVAAAKIIAERHAGKVPQTMEELLSLPGVARKTANVILGNAFGKNEGIAVDTHVRRVSGRLGFTRHDDPVKIERDLMEIVPRKDWTMFAHALVFHGRRICVARKPACAECPVNKLCPSAFTFDRPKKS